MTTLAFADEIKRTCRYCATFARGNTRHIGERGLIPRSEDDTATVTFVNFDHRTFAVTALHVIDGFRAQVERENAQLEWYFLPAAQGVLLSPPFIAAPQGMLGLPPDIALREIDSTILPRLGKEPFELRPDVRPVYPVAYAAAVGFPTASKANRVEPLGNRLAMPCVQAFAEGVGNHEHADQVQFFSEVPTCTDVGSLSGMSGGPVFWSDGQALGLLGFVKEALDVEPRPGEDSIFAGPRVNFVVQHATYEIFGVWAEHALLEYPKRRGELNQLVSGESAS